MREENLVVGFELILDQLIMRICLFGFEEEEGCLMGVRSSLIFLTLLLRWSFRQQEPTWQRFVYGNNTSVQHQKIWDGARTKSFRETDPW